MQVYICSSPRLVFGEKAAEVSRAQVRRVTEVVYAFLRQNLPPVAHIRFRATPDDWESRDFAQTGEDAKFYLPHKFIAVEKSAQMDYVDNVCAKAGALFDEAVATIVGDEEEG